MKRYLPTLLFCFVLLWVASSFQKAPITGTTFSARSSGTKAIFQLFQNLEHQASKAFQPFAKLEAEDACLFVIDPKSFGGETELLNWVKKGSRLVVFGANKPPFKKLRAKLGVNLNTKGDLSLIDIGRTSMNVHPINFDVLDVKRISQLSGPPFLAPAKSEVIAGSPKEAFGLRLKLEKGDVWLFSGSTLALNKEIDLYDNVRLIYQLASSYSTILFDEFHHGYTAPVPQNMRHRWNAVWLLLGCFFCWFLLGALSRATRFGPPTPRPETPMAGSTDFVSVFGLLCAEHRTTSVLRSYAAAWRARIEKIHGISQKLKDAERVNQLTRRGIIPSRGADELLKHLGLLSTIDDQANHDILTSIRSCERIFERTSLPLTEKSR